MPQLPASGIISASMVNVALGNPAGDEISWQDMATEYDLSSPNYGDSDPGLGLDELYGLYPAAGDFVFSDAFPSSSDTGWIIANNAQNQSTAQTNEGTISSITYNGTLTNTPSWAKTFVATTQTADVVVTIPQTDPLNQNYNNYPGTVSGQISTVQQPYNLEEADLSGGSSMGINAQTGEVSFTAGNDNAQGNPITVTNFTKADPNTVNPGAGEVGIYIANYSIVTSGVQNRSGNYLAYGVPDIAQGSGQYGNVGSIVQKNLPSATQYASSSIEVTGTSGTPLVTETGPGTGSITFDYDEDGPSNGKALTIDITNGYNVANDPMSVQGIVMTGSYGPGQGPGTPQFSDRIVIVSGSTSTDSGSLSMGGYGMMQYSGTGENLGGPPMRVYMNGRNFSTTDTHSGSISFTTEYGGTYKLNVYMLPNISFTPNPTSAVFTFTTQGSTTKSVSVTTGLSWTATISNATTGHTFSFNNSSSVLSQSYTGNATVTVYTTAANTGAVKNATLTLEPTGYSSLKETYSLTQIAATLTSNAWANTAGSWINRGASTTTITIQQSSAYPYAFSPTFFPIAMQTSYASTYNASISSTTYISLGTTSSGGSTTVGSVTPIDSVTANPALAQFYVNIGYSPGSQFSNTTYYSTTITVTFANGHTHYIAIRLQGSGTGGGGGTPPGGGPGVPPGGGPGGPPPAGDDGDPPI